METNEQIRLDLERQRATLQAAKEQLAHDLVAHGHAISDDGLLRLVLIEARCQVLESALAMASPKIEPAGTESAEHLPQPKENSHA